MIEIYLKYDNMHTFGMINALNCINNHVNSSINSMLSRGCVWRRQRASGNGDSIGRGECTQGTREFGKIPKRPSDREWRGDGGNLVGERGKG